METTLLVIGLLLIAVWCDVVGAAYWYSQ